MFGAVELSILAGGVRGRAAPDLAIELVARASELDLSIADLLRDAKTVKDDDSYISFMDSATQLLEQSLEHFRARDSAAGANSLEHLVALCESHPGFALRHWRERPAMQEVVQACIRDAMHRRIDVAEQLGALLHRIGALGAAGLH